MMRLSRPQVTITELGLKEIAFGIGARVSSHMNRYCDGVLWNEASVRMTTDRNLHVCDYTGNSFILKGPGVYETVELEGLTTRFLTHHEWVLVAKRNHLADPCLPDVEIYIMLLTGEREVFERDMATAALLGLNNID